MPSKMWFNYTSEGDLAKSAAAAVWWEAEMGDREPMRDLVGTLAEFRGSTDGEGGWFGYGNEGELADVAVVAMAEAEGGFFDASRDLAEELAAGVPEGFDIGDFLRESARMGGYWDSLPYDITEGYVE